MVFTSFLGLNIMGTQSITIWLLTLCTSIASKYARKAVQCVLKTSSANVFQWLQVCWDQVELLFVLSENDHSLRYLLCIMRHLTCLCKIHLSFFLVLTCDVFDGRQPDPNSCKSCTHLELWMYAMWMGITTLSCFTEMFLIVLNDSKDAELYCNSAQYRFAHPKTATANGRYWRRMNDHFTARRKRESNLRPPQSESNALSHSDKFQAQI